jgi:peptidoglycan/LPS O-acetylase OafA/YrhL
MQMMGAAAVPAGCFYRTLDALRAIATIGVVVFHMKYLVNQVYVHIGKALEACI